MSSSHEDNGEGTSAPPRSIEAVEAQLDDDSDLDDPVLARNADNALLAEEDFLSDNSAAEYFRNSPG